MKIFILSLFLLLSQTLKTQNPLIFKGKIGSYPIELQFTKCDSISGKFEGKYRYAKKNTYLQLSGYLYSPTLFMYEINGKDTTGQWYLEMDGDSLLGYWAGQKQGFKVGLSYLSGNKHLLTQQSLEDLNKKTNKSITGTYQVDYHFINENYLSKENYTPEIGYNGGNVTIKELDDSRVEFKTKIICGPSYHFAVIEAIAEKQGDHYFYRNEEGCEVTFKIQDKKLKISANQSFECGFGARAYLDHELLKVNNNVKSLDNDF